MFGQQVSWAPAAQDSCDRKPQGETSTTARSYHVSAEEDTANASLIDMKSGSEVEDVTDTFDAQSEMTTSIQIFVSVASRGTSTLSINSADTIRMLKGKVEDTDGIPRAQQRVPVFEGRELADDTTVASCYITAESTVHVVFN